MSAAPKADEFDAKPRVGTAAALGRLFAPLAALCLVLGPLVGMLLSEGGLYRILLAVLVFLVAAGLWAYCGHLIYENIRLAGTIADLQGKLSAARKRNEIAVPAPVPSPKPTAGFVATISHELRTPLTALLGMAQLLDRTELVGPQRNHVKVMLEAGRALQTLLDDLVALTHDAPAGECDPGHAVRAISRLLQPLAWEKRLRLSVTVAPNLPHVGVDPPRLRQAVLKLAENGLKFTEHGEVAIRVEPVMHGNTAFIRFSVADTGYGISPDARARLFSHPALDPRHPRKEPGMGLGLAVVKRIVEQAGGDVGFDSQSGQGSVFWFDLPPASGRVASVPDGRPSKTAYAPTQLRVLIATPDMDLAVQLAVVLEPHGNRVDVARSIADGASRAGRIPYDAIIARADDADTLAAAPGVRSPVLALRSRNDRKPLCANEELFWPAEPGQLYAALSRLCTPAEAEQPASDPSQPIDMAAFATLETSVGKATLVEILRSYIDTTEQLCMALEAASDGEQWSDAARLARDIAGAAGGLGLAALTATARTFAAEVRQGGNAQALRSSAHTLVIEQDRIRQALEELYPELVA